MDDEPMDQCPFDASHMIIRSRYQFHLVRCAKNYPNIKLKRCQYDSRHFVHPKKMKDHYASCPARESTVHAQKEGSNVDKNELQVLPINSRPSVTSEETWETNDIPTNTITKTIADGTGNACAHFEQNYMESVLPSKIEPENLSVSGLSIKDTNETNHNEKCKLLDVSAQENKKFSKVLKPLANNSILTDSKSNQLVKRNDLNLKANSFSYAGAVKNENKNQLANQNLFPSLGGESTHRESSIDNNRTLKKWF